MRKLTDKIKKVAKEQGLLVTDCEDKLNSENNYMVRMYGRFGASFFKSYEEVESFLGINEWGKISNKVK